jgi:hypothetical protein
VPSQPNTRRAGARRHAPFDAPIVLADGKRLVTLRDAIKHLGETIPKREHGHPRIVIAATVLTDAAEGRDFLMHARIAVIRARW